VKSEKVKKKYFVVWFVLTTVIMTAVFPALSSSAASGMPDISGIKGVCVYNIDNDRMLCSQNGDSLLHPASTAKMMTGILALEYYKDRTDETVTVIHSSLGEYSGKNIGLLRNEEVTVEQLLYAVICGGANDAANVLAYEIAGSHNGFVNMMNEKAKELGMKKTSYSSPNGYPDSAMYTTAEDVVLLAKYAFENKKFMEISSVDKYIMPQTNKYGIRYIHNGNHLISQNVEVGYKNKQAMGMSAGYTEEDGDVLVTAVQKNGMTNIFVLLGGGTDGKTLYAYDAVGDLIDWSFNNYGYRKIIDEGEMVCEVGVNLSSNVDFVILCPNESFNYYLPLSVDLKKDIERKIVLYEEEYDAPVEAGKKAGELTLIYEGKEIAKLDLVTKNNVNRNGFLYALARIETFTKSQKFKTGITVVLVVFVLYIAAALWRNFRRVRRRYKKR